MNNTLFLCDLCINKLVGIQLAGFGTDTLCRNRKRHVKLRESSILPDKDAKM